VFAMSGDAPCSSCSREIAYVSWSDSSITVRVPSGAVSGFVAIETRWGTSNPIRVSINRPAGSLVAERPVEIAVRYGARLHSVEVAEPADTAPFQPGQRDIALRLPSPPVTLAQRAVRALNDEPSELRFEQIDGSFEREVVRTMILDRYALRADLDPARMATGYERESGFFAYYTRPLPDLPVDSPRVNDIAVRLRSGRAAPYRIAEAAYEATLDTLTYALGRGDHSVLAGLESGYGDDYTYAMLFVSLLRAAEVPSRPVGGVLVTDDNLAYSHFWAEFFVTGVGWIPVDPSLGDGAFPARFPVPDDPRSFYFGNLDNRRISFQRGCDVCEPTFLDGPVAFPDDPYTQQRTYAVGGSLVSAFTLDWYRPRVFGRFGSD
ncbi:MAG: transglutaminase-like domain-containing protein, partial [Spirochaetota bacterium]